MFPKAVLTTLFIGALSVNALTVPVARSPAPEPECEFPRSFSTTSYHDLTSSPSIAQELEARILPMIGAGLEARDVFPKPKPVPIPNPAPAPKPIPLPGPLPGPVPMPGPKKKKD